MGLVLMQAIGNQHTRGQAGADAGGEVHRAAAIADGDELTLSNIQTAGVFGMDKHQGHTLALLTAGGFVER